MKQRLPSLPLRRKDGANPFFASVQTCHDVLFHRHRTLFEHLEAPLVMRLRPAEDDGQHPVHDVGSRSTAGVSAQVWKVARSQAWAREEVALRRKHQRQRLLVQDAPQDGLLVQHCSSTLCSSALSFHELDILVACSGRVRYCPASLAISMPLVYEMCAQNESCALPIE